MIQSSEINTKETEEEAEENKGGERRHRTDYTKSFRRREETEKGKLCGLVNLVCICRVGKASVLLLEFSIGGRGVGGSDSVSRHR